MKRNGLILSLILLAAITSIGYASITASKYNEVSSLASIQSDMRVTVQGNNYPLGMGSYVMSYNGKIFQVEARGAYAIARHPETGEAYALFILTGKDGFAVAALYPASDFVAKYGGSPIVESTIVVDGIYRPGSNVVIYQGSKPVVQAKVLEVQTILKGCHASYEQEQATVK